MKFCCIKFLFVAAFALAIAVSGSQQLHADGHSAAAMTKKVIDDHLADFGTGNIDAILANYADDSVVIVPGKVLRGPEALRPLFEDLVAEFSHPDVTFELLNEDVADNMLMLVFRARTGKGKIELGTDTFIVRDGKIAQQTIVKKYAEQ